MILFYFCSYFLQLSFSIHFLVISKIIAFYWCCHPCFYYISKFEWNCEFILTLPVDLIWKFEIQPNNKQVWSSKSPASHSAIFSLLLISNNCGLCPKVAKHWELRITWIKKKCNCYWKKQRVERIKTIYLEDFFKSL